MLRVGPIMGASVAVKGNLTLDSSWIGSCCRLPWCWGGGRSSIAKTVLAKARGGNLKKRMLYTDVVGSF